MPNTKSKLDKLENKLSTYLKHPSAPLVTFVIGLILGLLLSGDAKASERHNTPDITEVTNVYPSHSQGIAIGIATAQHHFDFGTHSWQGSIGVANYDNENAVSFGLGKRFDRMMINISVGNEANKTAYGAGLNWRF